MRGFSQQKCILVNSTTDKDDTYATDLSCDQMHYWLKLAAAALSDGYGECVCERRGDSEEAEGKGVNVLSSWRVMYKINPCVLAYT